MKLGRIFGWIVLGSGLVLGLYELLNALEAQQLQSKSAGEIWFLLDQTLGSSSLNTTQAIIQRYIWAPLWTNIEQEILLFPAWLVLIIVGTFSIWLFRKRHTKGEFRR